MNATKESRSAGCTIINYWSIKHSPRPTRRLVLVDIENYCGKGKLTERDAAAAKRAIEHSYDIVDEDLIIVGTSHTANLLACWDGWPGARHVIGYGHDGADHALIEAFHEHRLDTFAKVILVSGDGIFAGVAERAKAVGTPTVVASREDALSRRLACFAAAIRYIRTDEPAAA